jgi:tetratricopeptide (TPR) repeat protein
VDTEPEAALAWCQKAIAAVEPVHVKDRKHVTVRHCLGGAYAVRAQALTRLNRRAEAREAWDRARALDPQLVPERDEPGRKPATAAEYVNRGVGHSRQGELDQAIADYTQALKLDPKLAVAYRNRGRDHAALGQHDRAIADFTASIRLEPEKTNAYVDRARCHLQKGEHDRAIADYSEAIRRDPKNGFAYSGRGQAHLDKEDFDRAIADLTQAIRLNVNDSAAYFYRGHAHAAKDDYDKAVADFTHTIRLDPQNSRAYSSRGHAYTEPKDNALAVADFQTALRLDADNADAHAGLAWLLATCPDAMLRDGRKALEHARKACELTGWKEPVHLDRLAAAYAETGDFKEAVKWLQQALASPGYPKDERDRARQRLKLYQAGKPYRDE